VRLSILQVRRPCGCERLRQLKARESERLGGLVPELPRTWQSGNLKLYVTAKALGFRRDHRAVFLEGDYLPLKASGTLREHVCAFARSYEGEWVMVSAADRRRSDLVRRISCGAERVGKKRHQPASGGVRMAQRLDGGESRDFAGWEREGAATGGCVSPFPRSLADRQQQLSDRVIR
jgi:maltooligosyltrehalose synthase